MEFRTSEISIDSYKTGMLDRLKAEPVKTGECPFCGWTEDEYRVTRLVGCPLCYSSLDLGNGAEQPMNLV